MLSRIAESLFWIGRYVERADGTARLLDVHLQLLLEDPWVDEDTACRSLLKVIGANAEYPHQLTRQDLLNILSVDRGESSSIASSLTAARENARRVREIVSTELWECLNTTRSRMPRKVALERSHDFFGWVRERTALAVGIVESSTSRDEAAPIAEDSRCSPNRSRWMSASRPPAGAMPRPAAKLSKARWILAWFTGRTPRAW